MPLHLGHLVRIHSKSPVWQFYEKRKGMNLATVVSLVSGFDEGKEA